jgi:hypothetical protein
MNKIGNTLKEFFENKKFKFVFSDEVYHWDGENEHITLVPYQINYYLIVDDIIGEGKNSIVSIDIVVNDILENGYSIFSEWKSTKYYEREWYILYLEDHVNDELYEVFPSLSFHTEVYPDINYLEMKKGEL